jgi:hypothetical protein
MTSGDLFREAVAELYSADPDNFIERRNVLAAEARAAGQAPAAKRIAGLRRPTRSAWVVNQLVRSEPGVTARLTELGDELRAAQRSLDGATIRELSLRRRKLVDALTRQAFTVAGQRSASAVLREEVSATLGAALADPQVAEQLGEGTLARAARADGFGPAGALVLTLVTSSGGRRAPGETKAPTAAPPARPPSNATAPDRARRTPSPAPGTATRPLATARAKAERERRGQAVAAAEQAVAEADQAAATAAMEQREQERIVASLEEQLAGARRLLADARIRARQATARQRRARQSLDSLPKQSPPDSGFRARSH